jgi:hypothetical protein
MLRRIFPRIAITPFKFPKGAQRFGSVKVFRPCTDAGLLSTLANKDDVSLVQDLMDNEVSGAGARCLQHG